MLTSTERLVLAEFLADCSGLTREAYELDLRQYASWCHQHHLRLFQAHRSRASSKSAVSRRLVAATETALAELMSWRLDDLDLVSFMVDGVHFGEHLRCGAGHRHRRDQAPAGGGGGLDRECHPGHGLDHRAARARPGRHPAVLAVLDGAKALSRAVKDLGRDGTMALRWCVAGMFEAGHQCRRVNGHLHLP